MFFKLVNQTIVVQENLISQHVNFLTHKSRTRGGRPTTSISSAIHILIIFLSEQHRNPRPYNIIFFQVSDP